MLIQRIEAEIALVEEGQNELIAYHECVIECLGNSITAFEENDAERARVVVRAKPDLIKQQRDYRAIHYDRLEGDDPELVTSSEVHLDLVDDLRRIYAYSESIALTMLEGYLDTRTKDRPEEAPPISATRVG